MLTVQQTTLPNADRGYIYFAQMTIDGDTFMKVGYSRDPNRRFHLDEFEDVEAHVEFKCIIPMLDWMFDFPNGNPSSDYWELFLHETLRRVPDMQYIPEHQFSGYTECYKMPKMNFKAAVDYLEEHLQDMGNRDFLISY